MLSSPSSVSLSLDTFSFPGEGIYGRAFSAYLAVLASFRSQPRLLSASNYVPQGSGQRSWTQGLAKPDKRGKAGSERRKACFHPGGSGFHLPCGVARATPCFHPIDFYVTNRFFVTFFPEESNVPPFVPFAPAPPTSSPAPDRPRCSAGTHPPVCPRRESGASGAFAARTAG